MGDERSTVEAFAAAVARMVDPFANRARLLESMGLDEAGWRELDAGWRAEIERRAAAGDRTLADAFTTAFAHESARIARERPASAAAPRPSQLPRSGVDETAIAEVVLEPALPFAGSRDGLPLAGDATITDDDLDNTAVMGDGDDLGRTLPFDEER